MHIHNVDLNRAVIILAVGLLLTTLLAVRHHLLNLVKLWLLGRVLTLGVTTHLTNATLRL